MNAWKSAALAASLATAAGMGAAIAPAAHAQTTRVTPRAVEVFGARGGRIGVSIRDLRDDDKSAQSGVVVEEVSAESPAEKAGIKKGDVITEFDGEHVRSVRQFTRLVQETPTGRKVQAMVMRDGQRVNVSIQPRDGDGFTVLRDLARGEAFGDLAENFDFAFPTPPPTPARPSAPAPPAPPAFPDFQGFIWRQSTGLGLTVSDLSGQLADYFGVKDGVLVTAVSDNSAAAKAGLKAGDVITAFNGGSVTNPSDLRRRIQRLDSGDEFTIAIVRDKKALTLKGKYEPAHPTHTTRTII